MKPTIYLSGDHAGFELKNKIRYWLKKKGYETRDFGPYVYNKDDDYPDFVIPMARSLLKCKNKDSRGVIVAGSGEGEAIAVNKLKGIRASVYHGKNLEIVKTTREHNDANVLCMGARFVSENEMKKAIELFLKTKFQGGRHLRRINKYKSLGS
ncbi:MAG: RpiB/LacA/LacB family sugar-phosphate isomerase [Nanoarchaeota archaeon]